MQEVLTGCAGIALTAVRMSAIIDFSIIINNTTKCTFNGKSHRIKKLKKLIIYKFRVLGSN
jgi:hypothetical protein